ncbi:MAG: hypothetical protein QOJ52_3601 [Acidimicrobiaceae bacterium]|jgi:hypothetical protein|nr:hypothetical protein [Acidimicrobiaceae bacterium]
MARRMFQLLLALMVSALPLVVAVAPARADNASALLSLVNALRASHGVGPLYADPTLTAVAQGWSAHMAYGYGLGHNPNVGSQLAGGWTKLGENVGEGGNMNAIFNAFVNSSFHLGNMLDPTYNLTGIGVAVGRLNTLWVTQDFEAKPGATPATTRPPATTPTTSRPTTTAAPTTKAPVAPASVAATTTTAAAPPTTAVPPPTVPTTLAGVTGDLGGVPGVSPVAPMPSTPDSSVPGKLAAAAVVHGNGSGTAAVSGLIVAGSAVAIVLLGATAFYIKRLLRSP